MMNSKEKAGWLADKICNGGDYAKEAAIVLVRQAEEIELLQKVANDNQNDLDQTRSQRDEMARALSRIATGQIYDQDIADVASDTLSRLGAPHINECECGCLYYWNSHHPECPTLRHNVDVTGAPRHEPTKE
jgi:hypothetical protein